MMFACLFCWWLYLLTEASVNAETTCWKIQDVYSKRHRFIRCPNSMIIVKDIKFYEDRSDRFWKKFNCTVYMDSYMTELLKCNGLQDFCAVNDWVILADLLFNCDWDSYQAITRGTLTVCTIYDCIHGQINNLMHNPTMAQARGSLYQAIKLKGFLRCAIHGHITNITVIRSNSLRLWVRDEHGHEILHFVVESTYSSRKNPLFALTKNSVNKDALEVTMYTEGVTNVTFIVEGGMYYKCRNTTLGLDTNNQAETVTEIHEIYRYCQNATFGLESNHQTKNRTEIDRDNFQGFSVHTIPWILASIFMTLSLVLTIICVTLCLLRRKYKKESPENEIPTDLLYNNQQQNYFESELYMENRF